MKSRSLFSLLFTKRCVGCHTLIREGFLCRTCYESYVKEITDGCQSCGKEFPLCRCQVKCLGSEKLMYALPYKGEDSVSRELILYSKKKKDERIIDELGRRLKGVLDVNGISSGYLLTYVPRATLARVETGVDQAKEMARVLSRETGLELSELLRCRRTRYQQKELSLSEREAHAKKRFCLKRGAEEKINGRRILLFDDVVTSGATLKRCAELLYNGGADEVICIAAARSVKYL